MVANITNRYVGTYLIIYNYYQATYITLRLSEKAMKSVRGVVKEFLYTTVLSKENMNIEIRL